MMHYLFILYKDDMCEKKKCKNLLALVQYLRERDKVKYYTISSGLQARKESDYEEIK